jgi:hypothetical protein
MSSSLSPVNNLTVSSKEVINYLTAVASGNEQVKTAAFSHLIAILLRATDDLYLPNSEKVLSSNTPKYDFAVDFLLEELHPYLEVPSDMVLKAAFENKFRYLGRKFRCRVLNKIRDLHRAKKRVKPATYNDDWDAHQPRPCPPPLGPEEFDAFVRACEFLSERDVQTAMLLYAFGELRNGSRTQALAHARGVTAQTARADIRHLRQECSNALNNGSSAAKELFDRLADRIRTAEVVPRDLDFWDPANSGTSIQTSQFERSVMMKSSPSYDQDPENDFREHDSVTLRSGSRGYSWDRSRPYQGLGRMGR